MQAKLTDLAAERTRRSNPASRACSVSSELESLVIGTTKQMFAWQRMWLRLLFGASLILLTGCATALHPAALAAHQYCGKTSAFEREALRHRADIATFPHRVRIECNGISEPSTD